MVISLSSPVSSSEDSKQQQCISWHEKKKDSHIIFHLQSLTINRGVSVEKIPFPLKKNPPSSMWGYSCQGRSSSLPNIQFMHIQAQFSEFLNSVLGFCHQVTLAHRQYHTVAFERYCLKQYHHPTPQISPSIWQILQAYYVFLKLFTFKHMVLFHCSLLAAQNQISEWHS